VVPWQQRPGRCRAPEEDPFSAPKNYQKNQGYANSNKKRKGEKFKAHRFCLFERKHIISHRGEVKQAAAEAIGRV
jgi:hypothetical protein